MSKPTRRLLILAAVLLGLGLGAAPQAEAGWWHHGYYGYYGYYGWGCTSYYSPCYTPVYRPVCTPVCSVSVCDPYCGGWYLGVRPGPIRRCLLGPYRWYRSYGCCSVCYADPCCCYDSCYDSCCVSSVGTMVDSPSDVQATQKPTLAPMTTPAPDAAPAAGTPNDPAPVPAPAPQTFAPAEPEPAPAPAAGLDAEPAPTQDPLAPMPPAEPAPAPSPDLQLPDPSVPESSLDPLKATSVPSSEGTISILVPENAQVSINGYVTKSTGRVRRYVAQNLKPGLVYPFNIQVKVVREGRTLTDSRQVKLSGGALEAIAFDFDKSSVDRIAKAW